MSFFYLSFAGDEGWLGCIHTEAPSFVEAVAKTHVLGINPGGEVAGIEIPDHAMGTPEGRRILTVLDRLLSMAELEALQGPVCKIPEEYFE